MSIQRGSALKVKRISVVFAAVAVPAMAHKADKAARQAEKQAQKRQRPGASSNVAPASGDAQKALPSSGGMPAGNTALLIAGALLAGGGILFFKRSAIS